MTFLDFATILAGLVLSESYNDVQSVFIRLQTLILPPECRIDESILTLTNHLSITSTKTQLVTTYQQVWLKLSQSQFPTTSNIQSSLDHIPTISSNNHNSSSSTPLFTLTTDQSRNLFALFVFHFLHETLTIFPLAAYNPINMTILHFLISTLPPLYRSNLLTDSITQVFRSSHSISPANLTTHIPTPLESELNIILQSRQQHPQPPSAQTNIDSEIRQLPLPLQPPTLQTLNSSLQNAIHDHPNPKQLTIDQAIDKGNNLDLFLPTASISLILFLLERTLSTQFITGVLTQFHQEYDVVSLNNSFYTNNPNISSHLHLLNTLSLSNTINTTSQTHPTYSTAGIDTSIPSSALFSHQTKFITQLITLLDKLCNLLQCSLYQIPNSHFLIPTSPIHAWFLLQFEQTMPSTSSLPLASTEQTTSSSSIPTPLKAKLPTLASWLQFCNTKFGNTASSSLSNSTPNLLFHDLSFTYQYPFTKRISKLVNIYTTKSSGKFTPEAEFVEYLTQHPDHFTFDNLKHDKRSKHAQPRGDENLAAFLSSLPQTPSPHKLVLQSGPSISLGLVLAIVTHGIVQYVDSTATSLTPLIDAAMVPHHIQQSYRPSKTELQKAFLTQHHSIYFLAWYIFWAASHHHFRLVFPILLTHIIQETSGKLLPIEQTTKLPLIRPTTSHIYLNEQHFILLTSSLSTCISTAIQLAISPHHSFDPNSSTSGASTSKPAQEEQFELSRRVISTIVEFLHAFVHGSVISPAPSKGTQFVGAPRLNMNNANGRIYSGQQTDNYDDITPNHDNAGPNRVNFCEPINFGLYTPTNPTFTIPSSKATESDHATPSTRPQKSEFTTSSESQGRSNSTWAFPILRLPITMLPDIEYFGQELLQNSTKKDERGTDGQTFDILDSLSQLTSRLQSHSTPSSLSLGLLGWLTPPPKASLDLGPCLSQLEVKSSIKHPQSTTKSTLPSRLADLDNIGDDSAGRGNDVDLHRANYVSMNFESWLRWCSLFVSTLFFDPWVYQYHTEALVALYDRQFGTAEGYLSELEEKQYILKEEQKLAAMKEEMGQISAPTASSGGSKQPEEDIDDYDWLQDERLETPTAIQQPFPNPESSYPMDRSPPLYLTYHQEYSSLQLFSKVVQTDFPSCLFSYTKLHPTTLTLFLYALLTHHFSTSPLPLITNLEELIHENDDDSNNSSPKTQHLAQHTTALQRYYKDLIHQQKYQLLSDSSQSSIPPIASPLMTLANQVAQIWQHPSATNALPTSTLRTLTQLLWYLLHLMHQYLAPFDAKHRLLQAQAKFEHQFKQLQNPDHSSLFPTPASIDLSSPSDKSPPELNWLMNLPAFSLLVNGVNVHLSSSLPEIRSFGLLLAQLLSTVLTDHETASPNPNPIQDIPGNLAPQFKEWNDCPATSQMDSFLHQKYPIRGQDVQLNLEQNKPKLYPEEHSVMSLYRGLLLIPCERKVSFLPLARPPAVNWTQTLTDLTVDNLTSKAIESQTPLSPIAQLIDSTNIHSPTHSGGNLAALFNLTKSLTSGEEDELGFDEDKPTPTSHQETAIGQHLHDLEQYEAIIAKHKSESSKQATITVPPPPTNLQRSPRSGVIGNASLDTMTLTLTSVHKVPTSMQLIDSNGTTTQPFQLINSSILQDAPPTAPALKSDLQLIPAKSSSLISQTHHLMDQLINPANPTSKTVTQFQTFDDYSDKSKLLATSFADSSDSANKLSTTAPKFLSHCIKILQQKGQETSPEKIEAIAALESLIRSSVFTFDFVTCCNDLYPLLLGLTSSVAGQMVSNILDDAENGTFFTHSTNLSIRERCIIALIACCPEFLTPLLFRDLLQNSNMSSFQQKFDILSWLAVSAQELAQGGNPKGILFPHTVTKDQIPQKGGDAMKSQFTIDPSLYQLLSTVMIDFAKPDQQLLYSPLPDHILQPITHAEMQSSQQPQLLTHDSNASSPFQIVAQPKNILANVPTTNSTAFQLYRDENQRFLMQLTPIEKKALFDAKLAAKTHTRNDHQTTSTQRVTGLGMNPISKNTRKDALNLFTVFGFPYFIHPLLTSISVNDLSIDQRFNNNADIFYKASSLQSGIQTSSSTVSAIRSMLSAQTNIMFTPGGNQNNNPLNALTMDPLLLSKALQTLSMLIICLGINCNHLPELLKNTLPIMLVTTKHTDLSVRRMSLLVLLALFEIITPGTKLHDQLTVQSIIDLVDWLQYVLSNYHDPDGIQVEQDEYSISLMKQIVGMIQNLM